MDKVNQPSMDVTNIKQGEMEGTSAKVEDFKGRVDEIITKVDKLEHRVNEVEQFYSTPEIKQPSTSRNAPILIDKDKEKHVPSMKKLQQDASRREAAAAKRMQELMRQFGTIFRQVMAVVNSLILQENPSPLSIGTSVTIYDQFLVYLVFEAKSVRGLFRITQHKWAWPFMQPVDVEGLGLHDYYQIIDRPMDFSTIKNQMEAKDGTGYKHVREICADVCLVFKNAMKYNDEKSDVHVMAKTLLEKFEEKWLQFLPKVMEEEKRREGEEAEARFNMQLAQEAAHVKLARDINSELYDVDMHIEELREMIVKRCRRISIAEKRKLGIDLTKLCPEDLSKALGIIAQNNPSFPSTAENVELDINAQSESTLWRLKFFVKDAIKDEHKNSNEDDDNNNNITKKYAATAQKNDTASKRKKEICDAVAKVAKRRNKKLG